MTASANTRSLLGWCLLWSAAFGLAEGAVVVYLRALYSPEGFGFPMPVIAPRILSVELARELATLAMLLGAACMAARGGLRRFALFAFAFGVWDLAYYAMLWAALDWPASLLDWDLLFLVPVPWTGPVLAPVLVSLALVAAGVAILREPEGRPCAWLRPVDWAIEIVAGVLVIASFVWNAGVVQAGGRPERFPWWLFLLGWLGGLLWFGARWRHRSAA